MLGASAPGPGPKAGSVDPGIGPRLGNSGIAVRCEPDESTWAKISGGAAQSPTQATNAATNRRRFLFQGMRTTPGNGPEPTSEDHRSSGIIGKAAATASSSRDGQVDGVHGMLVQIAPSLAPSPLDG